MSTEGPILALRGIRANVDEARGDRQVRAERLLDLAADLSAGRRPMSSAVQPRRVDDEKVDLAALEQRVTGLEDLLVKIIDLLDGDDSGEGGQ